MRIYGSPGAMRSPRAMAASAFFSPAKRICELAFLPRFAMSSVNPDTCMSGWMSFRPETNVPLPCIRYTEPSDSSSATAWRAVMRLVPYRWQSSRSEGSA